MQTATATPLKIGQSVRHVRHAAQQPAGQIVTIAYDFWTKQPSVVWVDFPALGKRECRARDLTPMPPPVVAGLRLVDGAA